MSYTTGRRYEQELVRRFLDAGWGALRLGASGGGGDADLPDVFAGQAVYHHYGGAIEPLSASVYMDFRPNRVRTESCAIELKSGKDTTLYVQAEEVEALEAFASQWGARAFLGARSTRQGTTTDTYLVEPERARMTDGGAYGLPIGELAERAAVVVGDDGVEWR